MYYLQFIVGFVVGQLLFMAICSYLIQRKMDNIDWLDAFHVFQKKELGGFVVAICFMLFMLFIFPDWINVKLTRAELLEKDTLTKAELAQKFFRTVSALIGLFAQSIPFVIYRKGQKGIEEWAKQNKIDNLPNNNP